MVNVAKWEAYFYKIVGGEMIKMESIEVKPGDEVKIQVVVYGDSEPGTAYVMPEIKLFGETYYPFMHHEPGGRMPVYEELGPNQEIAGESDILVPENIKSGIYIAEVSLYISKGENSTRAPRYEVRPMPRKPAEQEAQ